MKLPYSLDCADSFKSKSLSVAAIFYLPSRFFISFAPRFSVTMRIATFWDLNLQSKKRDGRPAQHFQQESALFGEQLLRLFDVAHFCFLNFQNDVASGDSGFIRRTASFYVTHNNSLY